MAEYAPHPGFSKEINRASASMENIQHPKFPRISFDKSIFIAEDGQGEKQTYHDLILGIIEKYGRDGKLVLKPNEFWDVSKSTKKNRTQKSAKKEPSVSRVNKYRIGFLRDKQKYFYTVVDTWYNYWKDQTGNDFRIKYRERIQLPILQDSFPVFLFHAEMIITIFYPETKQIEYKEYLESAFEFHANLAKKYLDEDHEVAIETDTRVAKKSKFYGMDRYGQLIVWMFLDPWIKEFFPEIWSVMSRYSRRINTNSKGVIETFFSFSIKKLTEIYEKFYGKFNLIESEP
ncbi:hypothetical protein PGT21_029814 [Puccinia graminis f. sp. tritici]|uniref:Uncharacterized protein n=1 Tax=Puccinia graminis f. sp. tritici TaxID=56615 RepID=A0A5B0R2S1_PUCGR|nr:hypothetical protein PGT21_029814 [Puccinia graminis f. sp. tritici]